MPRANATSTSGLSPRCFECPGERLRQTTAPDAHGNRGAISRAGQSIAGLQNVPKLLLTRANELERQYASRTAVRTPSEPRHRTERWTTYAKRVPIDIRHDPAACHAHIQPVLLAIAATGSDYWQQALGGRALCVQQADGRGACRVRAATYGGMDMRPLDAVVRLTDDGPRAYGSRLAQAVQLEPFCSAAAEAARLAPPALTSLSPEMYRATIACDEIKLNASMVEWIRSNGGALKMVAAQMMQTKPAMP